MVSSGNVAVPDAKGPASNSQTQRPEITNLDYFTIRGFMRSGTNWANNLLNLHPHVACFGEVHLNSTKFAFDQWLAEDWSVPNRMNITQKIINHFEAFAKETLLDCVLATHPINQKQFRWIGDRSPRALDEVIIRNAKQFFMFRDGRDVIVSWTLLNFTRNQLGVFDDNPEMLKKLQLFRDDSSYFHRHQHELLDNEQWVTKVAQMWVKRGERDFAFLKSEGPARVHLVRYEDLHHDTEKIRLEMYEFLGLDPSLAAPLDSGRYKTSAGIEQEDPTSLYRRGVVGDWQNYFTAETSRWFDEIAGDFMQTLNYTRTD